MPNTCSRNRPQPRLGGISRTASSAGSRTSAGTSAASNARMYRWTTVCALGSSGSVTAPASPTPTRAARARCSALLTAATVVPNFSATSAAVNASTPRTTSTARCRAGRTAPPPPTRAADRPAPPRRTARREMAPAGNVECGHERHPVILARPRSGRQWTPPPPLQGGQARMRRDPVQPRTDARAGSYRSRAFRARSSVSWTRSLGLVEATRPRAASTRRRRAFGSFAQAFRELPPPGRS